MERRFASIAVLLLVLGYARANAHKPITSRYTFNQDVFPIFHGRCGTCHIDGGVAPMSLMTYRDAYPWAESIRSEILSGHMPPGDASGLVRHPASLSARELDTVLTWAAGGTPEGAAPVGPGAATVHRDWPLGPPDLTLALPPVTLGAGVLETTREFVLPAPSLAGRTIRAIDLLPGMPAIVRRAVVSLRSLDRPRDGSAHDPVIALWLPGADVARTPDGTAFALPDGSEIVARLTYRKTWKYENLEARDQSVLGVYLSDQSARAIDRISLSAGPVTLEDDEDAIAVRVDVGRADVALTVRATLPDGSQTVIVRLATQPEWPRRFWLGRALSLPRGTRLEAALQGGDPADRDRTGIDVDVVPARRRAAVR